MTARLQLLRLARRLWRPLPLPLRLALSSPAGWLRERLLRHSHWHYRDWIAAVEPRPEHRAAMRTHLESLGVAELPLRAVLDARQAAPEAVQASLDSLAAQWLPWAAPIVWREGPLSACLSGQQAGGLITVLRAGDRLAPSAGYFLRLAVQRRPATRLWLSDEDRMVDGHRAEPLFHGQFDPLQYWAGAQLPGVVSLRWDESTAGPVAQASEWPPLLAAVIAQCEPEQIGHVDSVLLHRAQPAPPPHLPPLPAGLEREAGPAAPVLRATLPGAAPLVSILIPTRNGEHLVRQCLASIAERAPHNRCRVEILLIDNGSDCERARAYFSTCEAAGELRCIRVDAPFNYSALNNIAAEQARGELLLLLNNDIEVRTLDWLDRMAGFALRPEVGCVGAKLYYPDGRIQHAGVITGLGRLAGHAHRFAAADSAGYGGRLLRPQQLSAVTAACLMVRRETYAAVGGLDAEHLAVAFNDVDFCLRVREQGLRNVWLPDVELVHHESVSRGADDNPEKAERFAREAAYLQRRWRTDERTDPAYSVHLCHEGEDFGLNRWPRPQRPWLGQPAPPRAL